MLFFFLRDFVSVGDIMLRVWFCNCSMSDSTAIGCISVNILPYLFCLNKIVKFLLMFIRLHKIGRTSHIFSAKRPIVLVCGSETAVSMHAFCIVCSRVRRQRYCSLCSWIDRTVLLMHSAAKHIYRG